METDFNKTYIKNRIDVKINPTESLAPYILLPLVSKLLILSSVKSISKSAIKQFTLSLA